MDIESGSIWIDKFQTSVLISLGQFILCVAISLGVLALLLIALFGFSVCNPNKIFVKATIAYEGFFWVKIFEEVFSYNWVWVYTDANLFQ